MIAPPTAPAPILVASSPLVASPSNVHRVGSQVLASAIELRFGEPEGEPRASLHTSGAIDVGDGAVQDGACRAAPCSRRRRPPGAGGADGRFDLCASPTRAPSAAPAAARCPPARVTSRHRGAGGAVGGLGEADAAGLVEPRARGAGGRGGCRTLPVSPDGRSSSASAEVVPARGRVLGARARARAAATVPACSAATAGAFCSRFCAVFGCAVAAPDEQRRAEHGAHSPLDVS